MYRDELIELTYSEFVSAVATAKSKEAMRVRLTDKEKYLLKHAVSIEMSILELEGATTMTCPRVKYGVSDGANDEESIATYFAHMGASRDCCPSSSWM
jgi:hypothetical protein